MIYFIIKDPEGKTTKNSQLNGIQEAEYKKEEAKPNRIDDLQSSIQSLSDEEAKLTAQYIRNLLDQKKEK